MKLQQALGEWRVRAFKPEQHIHNSSALWQLGTGKTVSAFYSNASRSDMVKKFPGFDKHRAIMKPATGGDKEYVPLNRS